MTEPCPAEGGLAEVDLAALDRLATAAETVIERLRERVFAEGARKRLELRFQPRAAAAMAGTTVAAIRAAEAAGALPDPAAGQPGGRHPGYDLAAVNAIRAHFGTLPWRAESDPPLVMAVQNFKGGVGKSTLVCHLAQYLALRGYRVCVIDCDSQATTTAVFGLNPDVDVDEERETLYPFFRHGGPASLHYALRPTHWPGIALIAANLGLYDAEYEFAARLAREDGFVLDRLREGIATISDAFDVVLLDPPPALGMISLSVLRAADALLIPAPPSTIDFGSTAHFLRMLASTLAELARHGGERHYRFVRLLATKLDENKSAHHAIRRMMAHVFAGGLLDATLKDSAEIDNAAAALSTVYEVTGPAARTETHRRARAFLDAVGAEVEALIRATWPASGPAPARGEGDDEAP
ncbi:MAG: replication protein [Paracoccaceae bacterium]|nr:MAG: chromosome partitioning protein [Alphaproteobacteria bacterium]GIX15443.1 MAG: replication protein [Paracoccaceae bacterium]